MDCVRFFFFSGPWLPVARRSWEVDSCAAALLALLGELMSRSKGQLGKWGSLSTSGFLCFPAGGPLGEQRSGRPVRTLRVHGRLLGGGGGRAPAPIQARPIPACTFQQLPTGTTSTSDPHARWGAGEPADSGQQLAAPNLDGADAHGKLPSTVWSEQCWLGLRSAARTDDETHPMTPLIAKTRPRTGNCV